jgi:hypothetical protein
MQFFRRGKKAHLLTNKIQLFCGNFFLTSIKYILPPAEQELLYSRCGTWLFQKCLPNPEAGVTKILRTEYIHHTTSSMMHNHKSQYGTRATKDTQLKSRKIAFWSVNRANTVNMNAPLLLHRVNVQCLLIFCSAVLHNLLKSLFYWSSLKRLVWEYSITAMYAVH